MFTSFARRLTAWYVAAAVALVAIVLGAFSVAALYLYVQLLQANVEAASREAQAFSVRARPARAGRNPRTGESVAVRAKAFDTRELGEVICAAYKRKPM